MPIDGVGFSAVSRAEGKESGGSVTAFQVLLLLSHPRRNRSVFFLFDSLPIGGASKRTDTSESKVFGKYFIGHLFLNGEKMRIIGFYFGIFLTLPDVSVGFYFGPKMAEYRPATQIGLS